MATTTRKAPAKKQPATRRKAAAKKPAAKKAAAKKKEAKKDLDKTYDEFKQFEGQHYTGMRVGRSHHWKYDAGDWKETKITPDLWEINYAVTKRRKGHAPEGSGVPVGTEYHWYILAHQNVRKLNANDYTTSMTGLKYKLAHKRADRNKWSTTARTQRKRLVKMLREIIAQLEKEPVPLEFEYDGKEYKGEAFPISPTCHDGVCDQLEVTLNDKTLGIIRCMKSGWKLDGVEDQGLIDAIGEEIFLWYE